MRVIKSGIAAILCAAMVVTLAPAGTAGAAKKASIAKKASVQVGKTKKIKVKNAVKKATVKWSTSKKSVAKIQKQVKKGKKASVTIKGVKAGKATIKGIYKVGKKKTKLKCQVTVKKATPVDPKTSTSPSVAPTQPGNIVIPTVAPTVQPTKGPTPTPRPTNTPSPAPKNGSIDIARKVADGKIVVDGTVGADEYEDTEGSYDLLVNKMSVRGETTVTAASAKFAWDSTSLYALVTVTGGDAAKDVVTLYAANGDVIEKGEAKAGAGITATADGYIAEVKVKITDPKEDASVKMDIQITNGASTINYFDSITAIEYDKDADKWNFKDEGVKADKDVSVLGSITLIKAMEQPTVAYKTDKGAEIIAAANITDPAPAEPVEGEEPVANAGKLMTFVDTSFWTDVYKAAGSDSIAFANANVPDYKGNAEKVTLKANDRSSAQAYTIWDENYLYVLYDVKDTDISPASADHYDTDSVEFFLDEDFSRPEAYGSGDEMQVRVDVIDNAFSTNESGTNNYETVAHAVNITKDAAGNITGYQVEIIIKFLNTHKENDMMGMDLQINDCFTVETTGEDGTVTTGPDRAGTLTAYDTTNNAYQYPNVFGRIKLVK